MVRSVIKGSCHSHPCPRSYDRAQNQNDRPPSIEFGPAGACDPEAPLPTGDCLHRARAAPPGPACRRWIRSGKPGLADRYSPTNIVVNSRRRHRHTAGKQGAAEGQIVRNGLGLHCSHHQRLPHLVDAQLARIAIVVDGIGAIGAEEIVGSIRAPGQLTFP